MYRHPFTRRTTHQQTPDPGVAYENAHMVAHELVARISELIGDLPAPGSDHAINWGQVGDLREINGRLRELVEFMSGTEE